MEIKLRKRSFALIYRLIVLYKRIVFSRKSVNLNNPISKLLKEYQHKKKIVVFASGPSAKKAEINPDHLYLVTNNGYKPMIKKNVDYLLYLNDLYCVNRILADNSFYSSDQTIIFYYSDSDLHIKGWNYVKNKLYLLNEKNLIFLLKNESYSDALKNFMDFEKFFKDRNLPVKIQNSGMFLLLLGFYMATKLNLPLEIYGLDLGIGGNIHFDSSESPGKSVTRNRVKENTSNYLDFIYQNHFDVRNYSNFYGNLN